MHECLTELNKPKFEYFAILDRERGLKGSAGTHTDVATGAIMLKK